MKSSNNKSRTSRKAPLQLPDELFVMLAPLRAPVPLLMLLYAFGGPLWLPLAAVISGLSVASVLTLAFVPALYWLMNPAQTPVETEDAVRAWLEAWTGSRGETAHHLGPASRGSSPTPRSGARSSSLPFQR